MCWASISTASSRPTVGLRVSCKPLRKRAKSCASAGDESAYASTLTIPGGLEMTTSRDVLEALSTGAGPRRVLVSLGYSSWGEGQLESEITENAWLTVNADTQVIFDTPIDQRYDTALGLLGVQPWALSAAAGRA